MAIRIHRASSTVVLQSGFISWWDTIIEFSSIAGPGASRINHARGSPVSDPISRIGFPPREWEWECALNRGLQHVLRLWPLDFTCRYILSQGQAITQRRKTSLLSAVRSWRYAWIAIIIIMKMESYIIYGHHYHYSRHYISFIRNTMKTVDMLPNLPS